ncbi:MAG: hypothetical protein KA586_09005 [Candidatus Promineofilum sp.]|nr:hypothetical protein [Promineifilum sp.]
MEVLRDLIFGNQAREFAQRMTDLDSRLESVRRELKSEQDSRAQVVAKTASDQNTALRKESSSRLDKEVQIIGERIEQLTTDLHELVDSTRQTLETRFDRLQEDHNERFRLLEEEGRRRDDDLRSELLTISAWLEDKKTSRHDLGQMLEEIGQRLRASSPEGTIEPSDGA